jgi:hypothetical protein
MIITNPSKPESLMKDSALLQPPPDAACRLSLKIPDKNPIKANNQTMFAAYEFSRAPLTLGRRANFKALKAEAGSGEEKLLCFV